MYIPDKLKGNTALLVTGFLFGASSPLARLLSPYLSAFSVVGARFLFALPFALGFLLVRKEKIQIPRAHVGKLAFFSFIFPVSVIFYTLALFHTKISLAIFSFYIANLLTAVVIGMLLHKERMGISKKVAILLCVVALVLFTNPFEQFVFDIGIVFGYISGALQSVAAHFQKKYAHIMDEQVLSLAQIGGGIVLGLGIAWGIGDFRLLTLPLDALLIAVVFGFVIFCINALLIYGFKRADIGTGTILMSSELIFGPLIAYILFAEYLTLYEMIGGMCAIIATVLVFRK